MKRCKGKKIGDFLKKNYDYVEVRYTLPKYDDSDSKAAVASSTFAGAFAIREGKIFSLDGDSYGKNEEVLWFEEWKTKDVESGLTLIVKAEWMRIKNSPRPLKEESPE